jgi:hypothetical protein
MLLLGALFVLFAGGFWLYCLADVALTPSDECPRLPKTAWAAVVAGTFVVGAAVWLAVRRPAQLTVRRPGQLAGGRPAQVAGGRPGKGRAAREEPFGQASLAVSAVGPDDDPEFLHALDRAAR